MKLRPLAIACLAAAPALCADARLLELLPPRAAFVLGIDVRAIAGSSMAKSMAGEMKQADALWSQALPLAGFDPFKDVDELVMAAAGTGKNPPSLVAIRGRFAAVREKAKGTAYRGIPIGGKGDSSTAFLDDETMVAGDLAMVRAAIDRRGRGGNGELRAKAAELSARYQIYGYGTVPEGALPANSSSAAMKGIDRFQFGVAIGSGLDLTARLHARTPQDAQAMMKTVALATAMMGQQKGAGELARYLDIRMEGDNVHIALNVPEAELMRAVKARGTPAAPPPAAPVRDPRFAPDTALIVTGTESDGGTVVLTNPAK